MSIQEGPPKCKELISTSNNSRTKTKLDPSRLQASILKCYTFLSSNTSGTMKNLCGLNLNLNIKPATPGLKSSLLENLESKQKSMLEKSNASYNLYKKEIKVNNIFIDLTKGRSVNIKRKMPHKMFATDKSLLKRKFKDGSVSKMSLENLKISKKDELENEVVCDYDYDNAFNKVDSLRTLDYKFDLPANCDQPHSFKKSILDYKKLLVNEASIALIKSPNYKKAEDSNIFEFANKIAIEDPEFILKMALYCRHSLNIRSTSNFLLAFSSNNEYCKPYLPKYFNKTVVLPSDWIDIAHLSLHFKRMKDGYAKGLPPVLRKAMVLKFLDFDKYQLGKYNKVKSRKKKKKDGNKRKENKEGAQHDDAEMRTEDDKSLSDVHFTLKQLIRKLHINQPVDHVMALIGKRYPSTMEEFYLSKLPGTFDEQMAGQRMHLPIPETWETQISTKGNTAQVWQDLIDHKKLPFMAMLRNLKNMILANISEKHHAFVIKRLTDEESVINSKQFPLRFFSAYAVLDDLEAKKNALSVSSTHVQKPYRKFDKKEYLKKLKGHGKKASKPNRKSDTKTRVRPTKNYMAIDLNLLQRYKAALDTSVKISTTHNIPPIPGKTIVICDLGFQSLSDTICKSAKGLGKPKTVSEITVLMSLMCKYSCEECQYLIFGNKTYKELDLTDKDGILNRVQFVLSTQENVNGQCSKGYDYITKLFNKIIMEYTEIDNIICFNYQSSHDLWDPLRNSVDLYKKLVNVKLLCYNVQMNTSKLDVEIPDESNQNQWVVISGFSDQVLKFIAERGDAAQMTYIENIDKIYELQDTKHIGNLKKFKNKQLVLEKPLTPSIPRWVNCRIFISSTFQDMFSERDILVRHIFQELRSRARSIFVNVFEVDLRWGITDEQSKQNSTLELCLSEVTKCQFFVGILGERYGSCQFDYSSVEGIKGMEWISKHPPGASLTELEFHQCFNTMVQKDRAFFYFRDPSFIQNVPEKHQHLLVDENTIKLRRLKTLVAKSGSEVYDNYPCSWGGMKNGQPIVTNLESFGQRVLDNLWNAILRTYPENSRYAEIQESLQDEIVEKTSTTDSYIEYLKNKFVGRKKLLNKALDLITYKKTGIVLIIGKPGTGKSSLMASLIHEMAESQSSYGEHCVFVHCIGAYAGSNHIHNILKYLIIEIATSFSLSHGDIPEKFDELCVCFNNMLKMMSSCALRKVHIFIDGLDQLSDEATQMTWLPQDIPPNILFVLTMDVASECYVILKNRLSVVGFLEVGDLDGRDKLDIIRASFSKHGKQLDESVFNAQMKLLLMKKESKSPLYLELVCDEMKKFGNYQLLSEKLSALSPTIPKLLQDILGNVEMEFGEMFVKTALSSLVLARKGLTEVELNDMLNISTNVNDWTKIGSYKMIDTYIVPQHDPSKIVRFIHHVHCFFKYLSSFSQHIGMTLTLAHQEFTSAIKQRYMHMGEGKKWEKYMHMLLAVYFESCADPDVDDSWRSFNSKAFEELPYHIIQSNNFHELEYLLCSWRFVKSKMRMALCQSLLNDYHLTGLQMMSASIRKQLEQVIGNKRFKDYKYFVYKNSHILAVNPQLIVQQALMEDEESSVHQDVLAYMNSCDPAERGRYFNWVNKIELKDMCVQSINHIKQVATCMCISSDSLLLAVGFDDALVRIFFMATLQVHSTLIGHSSTITCISFVSDARLCCGSKDQTLSLWSIQPSYRLCLLRGHSQPVTGCASNIGGRIIVSAGWDGIINVWHGITGQHEFKLHRDKSRLNCIALHPEERLVGVGCWDATIKLWDIGSRKRVAVFRGHQGSVRDVGFNSGGSHLVSVDIQGDVKMWDAKHGSMVGSIRGHSRLVSQVLFSPDGNHLLTASHDSTLKVWSSSMGRCVNVIGDVTDGPATCVVFHPSLTSSSPMIAIGYHHGYIRMFNCASGFMMYEKLHTITPVSIRCLAFKFSMDSADETIDTEFLVAGRADATTITMDPKTGVLKHTLVGHKKAVVCVVCTSVADLPCIITGSEDFNINIYQSNTFEDHYTHSKYEPNDVLCGHIGTVSCLSLNKDETLLASVGYDKKIVVWDLFTKNQKQVIDNAHYDWLTCCSWSNNSNYLVTGSNDFNLKLWNMNTGEETLKMVGHMAPVSGVVYKYGCIVSSSYDGSVRVWSHKGVHISTLKGHQVRCNGCDLFFHKRDKESKTEDGSKDWESLMLEEEKMEEDLKVIKKQLISSLTLASCSEDGTIRIWKPVESDERYRLVGHEDAVVSVTMSRTGMICSGSSDGCIKIWKLPQEKVLVQPSVQPTVEVTSVLSSDDGQLIWAASKDGYVKLWLIDNSTNNNQQTYKAFTFMVSQTNTPVTCMHMLDENYIVIGSLDFMLSIWKVIIKKGIAHLELTSSVEVNDVVTSISASYRKNFIITTHLSGSIIVRSYSENSKIFLPSQSTYELKKWSERSIQLICSSINFDGNATCLIVGGTRPFSFRLMFPSSCDDKKMNHPGESSLIVSKIQADDLVTCMFEDTTNSFIYQGNINGELCIFNSSQSEDEAILIKKIKVHKRKMTSMLLHENLLFTSSLDQCIKVWKLPEIYQIGQITCPSSITSMDLIKRNTMAKHVALVCGTMSGNVMFLHWIP